MTRKRIDQDIRDADQFVTPVILAGGTGKRLWPLSRKSYPKQFTNLTGKNSLFQQCLQRLTSSEILTFAPPIIMTGNEYRFIAADQAKNIGCTAGSIVIEPEARNTAPAILAASILSQKVAEDAVILVAPSDHVIPDSDEFHSVVKAGLEHVNDGKLVTFGIKPTHPETGYGYLELSTKAIDLSGSSDLKGFVEKPDLSRAKEMLASGNFLWNAGIFLFRASDMITAFTDFAPETLRLVLESIDDSSSDLDFLRLSKKPWSALADVSVDFAIMEKANNLVAVPYSGDWSDLGGWDAVWSKTDADSDGNVLSTTAHAMDCTNSLLRSESRNLQIIGLGLNNIVAVAMPDAVLVASKDRAQDVKKVVELLKAKDIPQAEIFPKDHRPWGWFESLTLGERFQVKRICVKPGAALSLQSHNHRSEHWIVVAGTAKVTINENIQLVREGQSVYVPLGAVHRMENPGKLPMILIEVQIGTYLGEDDIIRYEDIYARS